jgi:hypothetical protein
MSKCEFIKVCDLTWDGLKETNYPSIKYCETCSQNVYESHTKVDMQAHICLNHCVFMASDHEYEKLVGVIGETANTFDWLTSPEFKLFIIIDGEFSEEKAMYLSTVFGKKLSEVERSEVLSGKRVFLSEEDAGVAKEIALMVKNKGFKIELVPNKL